MGFDEAMVRRVIGMISRNEYKRRQAPPGVKITPRAFGRDRRLPLASKYQGMSRSGSCGAGGTACNVICGLLMELPMTKCRIDGVGCRDLDPLLEGVPNGAVGTLDLCLEFLVILCHPPPAIAETICSSLGINSSLSSCQRSSPEAWPRSFRISSAPMTHARLPSTVPNASASRRKA